MSKLFKSGKINGMELSNRFVRSATWEGMAADDGAVTPKLIESMVALAKGGVGMIITGHAYVRQEGQAGPWQLGVYKDSLKDGLKEMAVAVHENGDKIVMQIAHAGHLTIEQRTALVPRVASDFEGLAKTPRHLGDDFVDGGLNTTDALQVAGMLADAGLGAIESVSGHSRVAGILFINKIDMNKQNTLPTNIERRLILFQSNFTLVSQRKGAL